MTSSVVDVFFKVSRISPGGNAPRYPYSHAFYLESVDLDAKYSQLHSYEKNRFTNFVHEIKKAFPETMTIGGSPTKFKLLSPGNKSKFVFYACLINLNNIYYGLRWSWWRHLAGKWNGLVCYHQDEQDKVHGRHGNHAQHNWFVTYRITQVIPTFLKILIFKWSNNFVFFLNRLLGGALKKIMRLVDGTISTKSWISCLFHLFFCSSLLSEMKNKNLSFTCCFFLTILPFEHKQSVISKFFRSVY